MNMDVSVNIRNVFIQLPFALGLSFVVSLFNNTTEGGEWGPPGVFIDPITWAPFVYGVLVFVTLLCFNRKLWKESVVLMICSSVSLFLGYYLGFHIPVMVFFPELVVSLIGGFIIWLSTCTLLLVKSFAKKYFLGFTIIWFLACFLIPYVFQYFHSGLPPDENYDYFLQFVWQAVTIFLLLRLFSHLPTQQKEIPVVSTTPVS